MAGARGSTTKQAEDTIARIRELNDQVLEAGRTWGQEFLDAYEQSMRTFADLQVQAAEGTNVDAISRIVKAQAEFTREVARYSTDAGRQLLK
jgi:hypothetical protein